MPVKQAGSRRRPCTAAVAAGSLFCALIGGPALAANSLDTECESAADVTLSSPSVDLDARVVPGHDLESDCDTRSLGAPQSDVRFSVHFAPDQADEIPLIRHDENPSVFAEPSVDTNNDVMPNLQTEQSEAEGFDASIPGVSNEELQRLKNQMYRKDI